MARIETRGVNLLRGNPEKAVKKLAWPLMLSMIVVSLYSIIDSFWIAGLGVDQLAAIGFVVPLGYLIISIGTSLGAGITAVVSRYIGEKNDEMADNAAIHSILLSILTSIIVTIIFSLFLRELIIFMGGRGIALDYAMEYGRIYFLASIFVVMPEALYGLLSSEGDNKRTMYVLVLCAVVNMILDPIFIYILNMGILGAAIATILSLAIVLMIIFYWIYVKKDTYVKPTLDKFNYNQGIITDILKVAVPATCEMILITFITAIMHFIILEVSTTDYIAVFENGWRMVMLATEPMIAISTALVSIVAVNYGARKYENIKRAYNYSMKLGTLFGIAALVIFIVFAPQLAYLFSYGETSIRLLDPTTTFFRIFAGFFIVFPAGIISTYVFQGLGKGVHSLIFTIIRELICATFFAVLFGIILDWGINGVWFGVLVGYTVGGLIAIVYAKWYLGKIIESKDS